MKKISPSLLSVNFFNIENDLRILEEEGIKNLHLDVMDGHFVPSISFGMPVISSLRKYTDMVFDVHIMVEYPEKYISALAKSGANMLSFHYEAADHHDRIIKAIKEEGMKAGIALNPSTPVSVLDCILPELDYVLIMSVNPGFGGQKFISYTLNKIKELNDIRKSNNLNFEIQVDGGVCKNNIRDLADLGVDNLVAGSAVFEGNIKENIKALKEALFN